jgi:hypothetical protein
MAVSAEPSGLRTRTGLPAASRTGSPIGTIVAAAALSRVSSGLAAHHELIAESAASP